MFYYFEPSILDALPKKLFGHRLAGFTLVWIEKEPKEGKKPHFRYLSHTGYFHDIDDEGSAEYPKLYFSLNGLKKVYQREIGDRGSMNLNIGSIWIGFWISDDAPEPDERLLKIKARFPGSPRGLSRRS